MSLLSQWNFAAEAGHTETSLRIKNHVLRYGDACTSVKITMAEQEEERRREEEIE